MLAITLINFLNIIKCKRCCVQSKANIFNLKDLLGVRPGNFWKLKSKNVWIKRRKAGLVTPKLILILLWIHIRQLMIILKSTYLLLIHSSPHKSKTILLKVCRRKYSWLSRVIQGQGAKLEWVIIISQLIIAYGRSQMRHRRLGIILLTIILILLIYFQHIMLN